MEEEERPPFPFPPPRSLQSVRPAAVTGLRDQKVRDSTPFESLSDSWASFPYFSLAIPRPHLIPIPPPSLRGGFEQPLTFLYLFFEGGGRRGFCRLLCRDVGEGKGHEWPPLLSLLASGGVLEEKGWGEECIKFHFRYRVSGVRRGPTHRPTVEDSKEMWIDLARWREHHHHRVDILCSWRRAPYGLPSVLRVKPSLWGISEETAGGGIGCLFKMSVSGVGKGICTVGCPKGFFAIFPYSSLD